jgi:RNA polymerase sigma factor (sigma-70 family)
MKSDGLLYGLILGSQTDERLCALVSDGDERAFAVLADRHRAELMRAALRAGAQDSAEDAVQDALLSAWKALRAGVQVRHPRAWLHQIVRHAVVTQARRRPGTEPLGEELAAHGVVVEQLANLDLARQVLAEIASLPERQREALIATEFGRRSRREIAAELGVSEGAVRQLVFRARDSVRMAFSAVVPLPLLAWLLRPRHGPAERLTRALAGANGSSLTQALLNQRGAGNLVRGGAVLLAVGAAGTLAVPPLVGHNPRSTASARPHANPGLSLGSGGAVVSPLSGSRLGLPAARGSIGGDASLLLPADGRRELATHGSEDTGVKASPADRLESAAQPAGLGDGAHATDGSQSTAKAGADSQAGDASGSTTAPDQAGSGGISTPTTSQPSGGASGSTADSGSSAGGGESSGGSSTSSSATASGSASDGSSSPDSSSQTSTTNTASPDN